MAEQPFSESGQWWIAGYQDSRDRYHDWQEQSGAVRYSGDRVTVDWQRLESFNPNTEPLQRAHHVIIGWMNPDKTYSYATWVGGMDFDYTDIDAWVEERYGLYG